MVLEDSSIPEFSKSLSKPKKNLNEGEKWILDNLKFETKRILKWINTNDNEYERLKREALDSKINYLKQTPSNDSYGDNFNRLVCQTADKLDLSLPDAEKVIKKDIENKITGQDIEKYLNTTLYNQRISQLKRSLLKYIEDMGDEEKGLTLTSIQYEINRIKTDNIWGSNRFEQIIFNGLEGGKINLITVLCLINEFDYKGGYTSNPNLNAYLDNPKLEAIPLIIDEMLLIPNFFEYYGIQSNLTIYIADTDYSEIGEFGPVNLKNLQNIKDYIVNVKQYLQNSRGIVIKPISELTNENPVYQKVKLEILEKVKNFKDYDFAREWYQKFEDDVERRFESQTKRKIFAENEIRQKTLELTRSIWACNAAQGVILGTLDQNTILISTERRERDVNYTIGKSSRENFPPVLYILKAAENWNRKLVQKGT
ncbi:MAG: hypothetical protein UR48_C0012G0005 [Microgenomates group bacterium GW2011_GWD1_33_9]|nr:MAG: hypothetical protein UR48_C0012G0005 [Microgenomates group bacterium GW2011_GWD1_33_9]